MTLVKSYAPLLLYIVCIFFVLRALIGKTEWTVVYLAGILPLRNVVDRMHMFPLGKDMVDVLIVALLFGTFVRAMTNKGKFFNNTSIDVIAVVLILYTFISLLIGSDYLNAYLLFDLTDIRVQTWKNYCILPVIFFITFQNIRDKKWLWRIVMVICLSMVLMDYYLVQQLSWFSSLESRAKINATFVFLGPNEVAAFYNQYTIILMSLYFTMKKGAKKIALLGLIAINIYCIMFLFSRAAYIAFFIGCFFLFSMKKRFLLIPLILIVVYWQMALPELVRQRIMETTNEYGELDRSSAMRLVVWERSLELFSENPITGVGYGVFQQMQYELGDTHNIYLKILAEQGLIGITIFLLLLFILFLRGIKLFAGSDDPLEKALGLGFSVAIIVLMVNNVFGDRWTYMEVSSNLWIFAALVERFHWFIKTEREKIKIGR
ncbi:MAG: O-antigen ligase family protein [Candidatus Omnitrophica bacterium]|nr:O-antigen ligase family protein [Candidatus Omnitrophota bacterium]